MLNKIKRMARFLKFYLIHSGSFKRAYLCDYCRKIHTIDSKTITLNEKIGIFVSSECAVNCQKEAISILHHSLFKEIKNA